MDNEIAQRSRLNRNIKFRQKAHTEINPHFELLMYDKDKTPAKYLNEANKIFDTLRGEPDGWSLTMPQIIILKYKGEVVAAAETHTRKTYNSFPTHSPELSQDTVVNRIATKAMENGRITKSGTIIPHSLAAELLNHIANSSNSRFCTYALTPSGSILMNRFESIYSRNHDTFATKQKPAKTFARKWKKKIY